ncbi:MAG: hypothetical protein V5788_00135 [Shewanella sp.]
MIKKQLQRGVGILALTALTLSLTACQEGDSVMYTTDLSTTHIVIDEEGVAPQVLYTVNLNAQAMFCGGAINYMEQLDNLSGEGTSMSGFNATAFLQPGLNQFDLWSAPMGMYEQDGVASYLEDTSCSATLFASFKSGEQVELTSLIVTEENALPTIKNSTVYPDKNQTPLINVKGVITGNLAEFKREVYIKTLPVWTWVRARPFNAESEADMKKLHRAYDTLIEMMEKRDYDSLIKAWSLSSREKAKAEGYKAQPIDFFPSPKEAFDWADDSEVMPRKDWSEYELESFLDGRIVRLKDEYSKSPLRIGSDEVDRMLSITPYFSFIDDQLVISR